MPIILAIEPDRRQAAHVSAIVRHRVGAELILADTTEAALDAIGSRVPDLVLVPALLSPQDDAALNAALRVIAAAAHVRALTIPVFANGVDHEPRVGGLLSRWMRGRSDASSDGCDPAVFAEQIKEYLREAAAERAAAVDDEFDPLPIAAPIIERDAPTMEEPIAVVEEFAAREPLVEEFTAVPPAMHAEPIETVSPESYEYVVRPAADAFAAVSYDEHVPTAEAAETVIADEPFVYEPIESAPAREYVARSVVEPAAPPAEPTYEFAFAAEPEFVVEPMRDLVAADRNPAPADETGEEIEDDAIVIDLSEDIEEISPELPAEAVFDGEPMGIYTMPSFEDEGFRVETEFDRRPPAQFDEPPVSRFRPDVIPGIAAEPMPRFGARAFDSVAPAEPVLEEFLDESEIVQEFAAANAAPIVDAVAAPAAALAAQAQDSWPGEPDLPRPVHKRDDGWVMTGLRNVWAWPTIEGVTVEPPSALASLEEFSDVLAPPAPVRQSASKPAAAERPKPAAAAPAKPAAPAAAAKPDHMEWAELVASLRQDIERRRNQPVVAATPAPRQPQTPAPHDAEVPRKRKSTPVQDEWGFFDPEQCGFAALLAKLDEFSDGAEEKDVRQPS